MEIRGTLKTILPAVTGQGRNGEWVKRQFVILPPGQYAKEICFQVFGDKGDVLEGLTEGEEIQVHFDLESREYNGKYYTQVNAWKIEVPSTGASSGGTSRNAPAQAKPAPAPAPVATEESEDLPF